MNSKKYLSAVLTVSILCFGLTSSVWAQEIKKEQPDRKPAQQQVRKAPTRQSAPNRQVQRPQQQQVRRQQPQQVQRSQQQQVRRQQPQQVQRPQSNVTATRVSRQSQVQRQTESQTTQKQTIRRASAGTTVKRPNPTTINKDNNPQQTNTVRRTRPNRPNTTGTVNKSTDAQNQVRRPQTRDIQRPNTNKPADGNINKSVSDNKQQQPGTVKRNRPNSPNRPRPTGDVNKPGTGENQVKRPQTRDIQRPNTGAANQSNPVPGTSVTPGTPNGTATTPPGFNPAVKPGTTAPTPTVKPTVPGTPSRPGSTDGIVTPPGFKPNVRPGDSTHKPNVKPDRPNKPNRPDQPNRPHKPNRPNDHQKPGYRPKVVINKLVVHNPPRPTVVVRPSNYYSHRSGYYVHDGWVHHNRRIICRPGYASYVYSPVVYRRVIPTYYSPWYVDRYRDYYDGYGDAYILGRLLLAFAHAIEASSTQKQIDALRDDINYMQQQTGISDDELVTNDQQEFNDLMARLGLSQEDVNNYNYEEDEFIKVDNTAASEFTEIPLAQADGSEE